MRLTDKNLDKERPHLGGVQRLYDFGRFQLSLVNAPMLHSYPFAWEAAVFRRDEAGQFRLVYDTPLTADVEVFDTDAEADAFIAKAAEYFAQMETAS